MEGVRKDLVGRVDQLAAQLAGLQSTWQERATIAETEARQLRLDLDAQGRLQQALQKQLDEERKAREELARQVSKLVNALPSEQVWPSNISICPPI